MSLSDKYGIPEEKIKLLIKDGIISCSYSKYEEVVYIYKRNITNGMSNPDAISNAADSVKLSERQVYRIIHKFE
jgi:hypothetical protein